MFKLCKKLRATKHDIKGWYKKQFGNLHERLTKNAQKKDYVEHRLLFDPIPMDLILGRHLLLNIEKR